MSLQALPEELILRIEQHLTYPDRVSLRTALSNDTYDRSPYQRPFYEFWKKSLGRIDSCFHRVKQNYLRVHGPNRRKHRRGRRSRDYDYTCYVQCSAWSLPLVYGTNDDDVKIFPWLVSDEERQKCTRADGPVAVDMDRDHPDQQRTVFESEYEQEIGTIWITVHHYMRAIIDPNVPPGGVQADWPNDPVLPAILSTLKAMHGTNVTIGSRRISMQIRCNTSEIHCSDMDYESLEKLDIPFCVKRYDIRDRSPSFARYIRRPLDPRWYVRWYCFHEHEPFPGDLLTNSTRFYEEKIDRILHDRQPLVYDILNRELGMFWRSYSTPVPFTQLPDVFHLVTSWPLPRDYRQRNPRSSYFRLEFVGMTREQFAAETTAKLHAKAVARLQLYLKDEFTHRASADYRNNTMRQQFPFDEHEEQYQIHYSPLRT